jgi:S-adenosylmethionine:tRNA ribosyltransferase-isomerase
MKLDDFDYPLPEELIAQEPLPERDASRLLVLHRNDGRREHRRFSDFPQYLREGDLLVLNDAKVIPARLIGKKIGTGGKVELLLDMPVGDPRGNTWQALGQASKAIRPGARLDFQGLGAEVIASLGGGRYEVSFLTDDLSLELQRVGRVPLPPYIRRQASAEDVERYQTFFAEKPGAAAAPTAGLHFTRELLGESLARGVRVAKVTLYVGAGTFLPIRTSDIEQHHMHAERFEVSEAAAQEHARARARGGRIIAVGTTAARTLESAWQGDRLKAGEGVTELFIYPGYHFQAVDALVTNFHLPRSTLLLLVSAFAGRDAVLAAYREAIALQYRFFSYGDAMLLL